MKFQYRLSTLFVLTTLAGIACGAGLVWPKSVARPSQESVLTFAVLAATSPLWLPLALLLFVTCSRTATTRILLAIAIVEATALIIFYFVRLQNFQN
jgi:hypothetical protein